MEHTSVVKDTGIASAASIQEAVLRFGIIDKMAATTITMSSIGEKTAKMKWEFNGTNINSLSSGVVWLIIVSLNRL